MQLQKLFPCWRALAEQDRIPWTRDFDLSRPQDLWAVLAITGGGQDAAVGTPSYLELAEAMVADAMALAEAAPPGPAQVALQYLQFTIALGIPKLIATFVNPEVVPMKAFALRIR